VLLDRCIDVKSPDIAVSKQRDILVDHERHAKQSSNLIVVVHPQQADAQFQRTSDTNGAEEESSDLQAAHYQATCHRIASSIPMTAGAWEHEFKERLQG